MRGIAAAAASGCANSPNSFAKHHLSTLCRFLFSAVLSAPIARRIFRDAPAGNGLLKSPQEFETCNSTFKMLASKKAT